MPAGITFAHDRSDIQPQFQSTLDQVAQTLQAYPSTLIDVYGHTDSTGSDSYNQALSERRARSVADYLIARGVQPVRIATQGYGESRLLVNSNAARPTARPIAGSRSGSCRRRPAAADRRPRRRGDEARCCRRPGRGAASGPGGLLRSPPCTCCSAMR